MAVLLIIVAETCQNKIGHYASNRSLHAQGHKLGFDQSVFKNPYQNGEVPKTAMASTLEALVGSSMDRFRKRLAESVHGRTASECV